MNFLLCICVRDSDPLGRHCGAVLGGGRRVPRRGACTPAWPSRSRWRLRHFFKKGTDIELKQIVAKMSKSLKNVVNPDYVVLDYGADSLRLYEMLMGPLDAVKPWQTKGIEGMNRFLGRAWPVADHSKAVENTVEVVFLVNGKVRAKASVAKDMDKAALEKLAMDNERVKEFMAGKTVVKSIVVPGKLVNIVVK